MMHTKIHTDVLYQSHISTLGILYKEAIWVYNIDAYKPLKVMHFKTKLSGALSTQHYFILHN